MLVTCWRIAAGSVAAVHMYRTYSQASMVHCMGDVPAAAAAAAAAATAAAAAAVVSGVSKLEAEWADSRQRRSG